MSSQAKGCAIKGMGEVAMGVELFFRERGHEDEGAERIVLAVDDTDDLTRATSTGAIAQMIADEAAGMGGRVLMGITRHQLLLDEAVPYTSHNSVMAFEVLMPRGCAARLRAAAIEVIAGNRAASSDPGLAVAVVPSATPVGEGVDRASDLVAFGKRAKSSFCSIKDAYALAAAVPWVTLSAHGGDESGVVGALAGIGLRLSGADGRFRGKWDLGRICSAKGRLPAGDVAAAVSKRRGGDVRIVAEGEGALSPGMPLALVHEAKPVFEQGAITFVCDIVDGVAVPHVAVGPAFSSGAQDGEAGGAAGSYGTCSAFELDNDAEERLDGNEDCRNCLNRRLVEGGIVCMLGRKIGLGHRMRAVDVRTHRI